MMAVCRGKVRKVEIAHKSIHLNSIFAAIHGDMFIVEDLVLQGLGRQ